MLFATRCNEAMGLIFVIILILLIIAAPYLVYSSGWGYHPSGSLGLILIVILIPQSESARSDS